MKILRRAARAVSGTMGRNSTLINRLRPAYDGLLELSTGGQGIVQRINGREEFRVDPHYRMHFPEVYDPPVCDYLREHVRPGDTCLNVGAHVGLYALCLAAWSAPGGRVFAFEPNPATRAVLEKHVALNKVGERIEVEAKAVSEASGEASFFATSLEGFSRLGQPNPHATHTGLEAVTVSVTSIDAFCSERSLTPNWITLDIEGYEIAALYGARETVRKGRGRLGLIVEMHPDLWESAGASRGKLETLLGELSLKPIPLTGQSDPFDDYGIVRLDCI